jgi:hypothetical protein
MAGLVAFARELSTTRGRSSGGCCSSDGRRSSGGGGGGVDVIRRLQGIGSRRISSRVCRINSGGGGGGGSDGRCSSGGGGGGVDVSRRLQGIGSRRLSSRGGSRVRRLNSGGGSSSRRESQGDPAPASASAPPGGEAAAAAMAGLVAFARELNSTGGRGSGGGGGSIDGRRSSGGGGSVDVSHRLQGSGSLARTSNEGGGGGGGGGVSASSGSAVRLARQLSSRHLLRDASSGSCSGMPGPDPPGCLPSCVPLSARSLSRGGSHQRSTHALEHGSARSLDPFVRSLSDAAAAAVATIDAEAACESVEGAAGSGVRASRPREPSFKRLGSGAIDDGGTIPAFRSSRNASRGGLAWGDDI